MSRIRRETASGNAITAIARGFTLSRWPLPIASWQVTGCAVHERLVGNFFGLVETAEDAPEKPRNLNLVTPTGGDESPR